MLTAAHAGVFAMRSVVRYVRGAGFGFLVGVLAVGTMAKGDVIAETPVLKPQIPRPTLRMEVPVVRAGNPVWIEFGLTNLSDQPTVLKLQENPPAATSNETSLPLEYIFSGENSSALFMEDIHGSRMNEPLRTVPHDPVPEIQLGPQATIGRRVDVSQYYDTVRRPGKYKLTWRPFAGAVESEPLFLTVLGERQAVILTDYGKMVMRFYYDEAPNHVANFIELIEKRFYDNLAFNRIVPNVLIQGGDPLDNRRGVRADGKLLKAEFSKIPFDVGTVGMARSSRDINSASCQFFICVDRLPALDGSQTAFGYLSGDESMETLKRIAALPVDAHEYPRRKVYIRAMSLENVPPKEYDILKHSAAVLASQPNRTVEVTLEPPKPAESTSISPPVESAVTSQPAEPVVASQPVEAVVTSQPVESAPASQPTVIRKVIKRRKLFEVGLPTTVAAPVDEPAKSEQH